MTRDLLEGRTPHLNEELLTRVLNPIETARGLPNACCTDEAVLELERQRVFAG